MFSGVVKIADIDDYITPSQNCIKPISDVTQINKKGDVKDNNNGLKGKKAKLVIGSIADDKQGILNEYNKDYLLEPNLIKIKNVDTKSAKITLNDCLACNGCVTTAETLLIQAQSVDEFVQNSIKENKISICCISPQSILSLAYYFDLCEAETMEKLCSILEGIGIKFVFNYNIILKYSLDQSYEEFKQKIFNNNIESGIENNLSNNVKYLIASECPGWICYAEKKIGEWIIPNLSNVKSPQQVMGNFLKSAFSKIFKDKEIFVSSIMPCFDKKLEATRENHKIKDNLEVDTVISTIEMLELFTKLNIDFKNYQPPKKQSVFYSFSKLSKVLYEDMIPSSLGEGVLGSQIIQSFNHAYEETVDKNFESQENNINTIHMGIKKTHKKKHKCKKCSNNCKCKDKHEHSSHAEQKNNDTDSDNGHINQMQGQETLMKTNGEYFFDYLKTNYTINDEDYKSFFYTENNFSSNGYVEYIIERLIHDKLSIDASSKYEVIRKTLKNSDYKEIELKFYNKENQVSAAYSFAIVYGFRNIQNLIRNKNRIKYQYLEIMACPGGCINGGMLSLF